MASDAKVEELASRILRSYGCLGEKEQSVRFAQDKLESWTGSEKKWQITENELDAWLKRAELASVSENTGRAAPPPTYQVATGNAEANKVCPHIST